MSPGTSSGADLDRPVRSPSTTIVPRGSPASRRRLVDLDARAEPAQHADEAGPRRVEPDILDLDARARQRRRGDHPEGGGREVAGHRQRCVRRASGRPRRSTVPARSTSTSPPKAASARSVWSRVCAGSVTEVVPVGVQAGQEHGALDLGARDARARSAMPCSGRAVNRQRRMAVGGLDAGAHPRERLDDAPHRPARQRRVADQDAT